jgi:5-methylcytosine-specific restriction protein A
MFSFGCLEREVCVFDFESFYGDVGKGFIECHHITPLYFIKSETKTSWDDLALVCSNCHRMILKSIDILKIEDLKSVVKSRT